MKVTQISKLVGSILSPLTVGSIAGIFTANAIPGWYATLNRPWFNPPNWVFGPVWSTLYIILGISFYLIWKIDAGKDRNRAIIAFLVQLFSNFSWSFFFFYFKLIGVALIDIVALWIMIVVTLSLFYKLKSAVVERENIVTSSSDVG